MEHHSLGIIGGGPAGISAAVYASRYSMDSLMITRDLGGWAGTAYSILNYPGIPSITGVELIKSYKRHLDSVGANIRFSEIGSITKKDSIFIVETEDGLISFDMVIYAGGTSPIKLGVPGEKEFLGKGVSYCATCDISLFKNSPVIIVGGGNSALSSAVMLSEKASSVLLVTNEKNFTAEAAWIDTVTQNDKITTIFEDTVAEIHGEDSVDHVVMESGAMHHVEGVFIEIGFSPRKDILKELDIEYVDSYIKTDGNQRTNVEGLYVAGDVAYFPLKQIITASSQGAVAAYSAYIDSKR